jgi:hypothetical protein
MNFWRVLRWMAHIHLCQCTGLSIPECSCRECCEGLLWRYAPALLDVGPLDLPCGSASVPIEAPPGYASAQRSVGAGSTLLVGWAR